MHMRFLGELVTAGQRHTAPRTTPGLISCALDNVQHGLIHRCRAKTRKEGHLQVRLWVNKHCWTLLSCESVLRAWLLCSRDSKGEQQQGVREAVYLLPLM